MPSSQLETVIHEMLTHNTGTHMLDSGGKNGRLWQRNAGKTVQDFKNAPQVECENETNYINFTVSTFHYLTSGVIELDETCDAFNALPCPDWDGEAYGTSAAQCEWLEAHGFTFGDSWNSYNGENNLSQVLQGTNLKNDGLGEGDYFLLQVHGGADVRGGYTDAKLFKNSSYQGGLNPCPDLLVDIDGVGFSSYGNKLTDAEGNAVKLDLKPDAKITAELAEM